jgi:DNA-binding GntR family transcriptional regulator
MATELAAPRFSRADVNRLRKLVERISETTVNYDAKTYLKLNREFHFSIYEKAENEELLHVIEGLWLKVGPVFTGLFDSDLYRQHANDEHTNIVDAIARKDASGARAFIERDLVLAAQSLMPRLPQAGAA